MITTLPIITITHKNDVQSLKALFRVVFSYKCMNISLCIHPSFPLLLRPTWATDKHKHLVNRCYGHDHIISCGKIAM